MANQRTIDTFTLDLLRLADANRYKDVQLAHPNRYKDVKDILTWTLQEGKNLLNEELSIEELNDLNDNLIDKDLLYEEYLPALGLEWPNNSDGIRAEHRFVTELRQKITSFVKEA